MLELGGGMHSLNDLGTYTMSGIPLDKSITMHLRHFILILLKIEIQILKISMNLYDHKITTIVF